MSIEVTRQLLASVPEPGLGVLIAHRLTQHSPEDVAEFLRESADLIGAQGGRESRRPWQWPTHFVRAEALIRAEVLDAGGDACGAIEADAVIRRAAKRHGDYLIQISNGTPLADWLYDLAGFRSAYEKSQAAAANDSRATANPGELGAAAVQIWRCLGLAAQNEARAAALAAVEARARRVLAALASEAIRTAGGADQAVEDLVGSRAAAGSIALEDPALAERFDAAERRLRPLVAVGAGRSQAGVTSERDRLAAQLDVDRAERLAAARADAQALLDRVISGDVAAVTSLSVEVREHKSDFAPELFTALAAVPRRVIEAACGDDFDPDSDSDSDSDSERN